MERLNNTWERIVELARRVDARATARRPPDEATILELARAVLAFERTIDRWRFGFQSQKP